MEKYILIHFEIQKKLIVVGLILLLAGRQVSDLGDFLLIVDFGMMYDAWLKCLIV